MSMSVHLANILPKLQITPTDRQTFLADAQEIENAIMAGIKERDTLFRDTFRGLSLTGSYLDRLRLHVPDEFDMHIKLELPFKLTIEKLNTNPGFLMLRVPDKYIGCHPIVNSAGFVDRVLLQHWLRANFTPVIESINVLSCASGYNYRLSYTAQGYGCAHTISAIDTHNKDREISFDFVPAFEFEPNTMPRFVGCPMHCSFNWFAVPQASSKSKGNTCLFMICAPHWEREAMKGKDKDKLKNTLRLMKALRDANDMSHLTSYMLKSVFLQALKENNPKFWRSTYAKIFSKMLGRLLNCLNRKQLPFFLAPDLNHFDRLSTTEIKRFHQTVHDLFQRVKRLKAYARIVPYEEVAVLFNIK